MKYLILILLVMSSAQSQACCCKCNCDRSIVQVPGSWQPNPKDVFWVQVQPKDGPDEYPSVKWIDKKKAAKK